MNTSNAFNVPSADAYVKALDAIVISDKQKMMLDFHVKAHNRTVTYTELARAAGYENFRVANSSYGKLGRALGEELGMNFVAAETRDEPFYSSSIGTENPYKPTKSDFQLVMHHELAKAVDSLEWFTK